MSALGTKLRKLDDAVMFHCPGCRENHMIYIEQTFDCGPHPVWSFNGDGNAPTFTPSILVQGSAWVPPVVPGNIDAWRANPWEQSRVEMTCHSFVTDGRIQFLDDCTHSLAGQTVDLPDWSNK